MVEYCDISENDSEKASFPQFITQKKMSSSFLNSDENHAFNCHFFY